MGRWSYSTRFTVEECFGLGMNDLKKLGLLKAPPDSVQIVRWADSTGEERGKAFCWLKVLGSEYMSLSLSYTVTNSVGEKKDLAYAISLSTTPCNFGGFRYWFICPLEKHGIPCNRRVGKLYLPPNGIYFGCRHCYNLTYRSCQQHDSRVGAILRLPPHQSIRHLQDLMESGSPRNVALGLRAYFKLLDKPKK